MLHILGQQKNKTNIQSFLFLNVLGIFFLCLCYSPTTVHGAGNNLATPFHVLVVHSAYQGYPWTDSLNRGIHHGFDSAPEFVDFVFEYIDTKRNSNATYFDNLKELWKLKYHERRIDLIIVCDNEAYDFVVKDREVLFGNTPIVFAAYIGFYPEMLQGMKHITGVVQETDIQATIDSILQLHPKTEQVVLLPLVHHLFEWCGWKASPSKTKDG